jgi:hypothetical protein
MCQCPLCRASGCELYHTSEERSWFSCSTCTLIHLDPALRLGADAEHARYSLHDNDADDPRYVAFLRRLADPLMERLAPGARGLDFGCGPTPVLAGILTGAGFPCEAYDPFFFPDPAPLSRGYDYVACSEVVEHAYEPGEMFDLFGRLLARGGALGVMTRFYGDEPFSGWWYTRDPTHVCFYAKSTMRWIAAHHGWSVEFPRADVSLFSIPPIRV